MALKDLLQSQKTIRELKTETAALRLEKEQAARQKEQSEARAAALSREADREAAGRGQELQAAKTAVEHTLFEAMRPLLLNLPAARRAIAADPTLLAKDMIGLFAPVDDFIRALGLTVIGTIGEETPYDSARHDCPTLVSPGAPVRVVTVGYARGEEIWVKARVKEVM